MKRSLNQILKEFEKFATNHSQIETFETKPITENVANNVKYPMMWVDLQATATAFQTGQVVINIPVYMLDRVERDYSNISNVLSVGLLKMDDFYTYFTDNECDFGFYFNDAGACTPVIYQFDDIVAGQFMTIQCQVGNSRNEDKIPFK